MAINKDFKVKNGIDVAGDATVGGNVSVTGAVTAGNVNLADNGKLLLGNSGDLEIYHSGTHSYISDTGTGNLAIITAGDAIDLNGNPYTRMLRANVGGSVDIYHDNSLKLATTSTGIDVTGTVAADGLVVDGSTLLTGAATTIKPASATHVANLLMQSNSGSVGGYDRPILKFRDAAGTGGFDIKVNGDDANTVQLQHITSSATKQRIRIHNSGDIAFYEDTGTAQKFVWDASAEKLALTGVGGLAVDGKIQLNYGGTDVFATIVGPLNRSLRFDLRDNGVTDSFDFRNAAEDTLLTIKSTGNVGIGTTTPDAKLDIEGNFEFSYALKFTNTMGTGQVSGFRSHGTNGESLSLYHGGYRMQRWDSGQAHHFETNSLTRMSINSAGNVGIGTVSPSALLEVESVSTSGAEDIAKFSRPTYGPVVTIGREAGSGVVYSPQNLVLSADHAGSQTSVNSNIKFKTDGSEKVRIDASGNVGIGTSTILNPGSGRTVLTLGNSTSAFLNFGTGSTRWGGVYSDVNKTVFVSDSVSTFDVGGTERMRIDSSGNVLVGTTSTNPTSGTGTGISLQPAGHVFVSKSSDASLIANRTTTDGDIAIFKKNGNKVGSIGVDNDAGSLVIDATFNSNRVGLKLGYLALTPRKSVSDSDATVNLGSSSTRFKDLYLSGGVYLGGTGSANKLNDYEEGTWTPRIDGTTTAGTHTYGQQEGYYTKVGSLVTVIGAIYGTGGTGTGNMLLAGFPFTIRNAHTMHGSFQANNSMTFPAGIVGYHFVHDLTGNGMYVRCTSNNANITYVAYPVTVNYVRFNLQYHTDD